MFLPFEVPFSVQSPNHIDLSVCLRIAREIGAANRSKVVKTWLNGWVTSHRMHEPTLHTCLLGCADEPDALRHYVCCPRVYAAAKFVVPDTSDNPLIRIGLMYPSKLSLSICACIFSGYHGLKSTIRCNDITVDMDYFSNWCLFAQYLNAEAVGCGLCATLFAPNRFASFLNDPLHSGST